MGKRQTDPEKHFQCIKEMIKAAKDRSREVLSVDETDFGRTTFMDTAFAPKGYHFELDEKFVAGPRINLMMAVGEDSGIVHYKMTK